MKKMIACLAVLAVAVVPSIAQQPLINPAQAGSRISPLETKAAFCQVDALLSAVDEIPMPAGESALCQASYSLEALPQYISSGGQVLNYALLSSDLENYYVLRALAFSSADQCAPLGPLREAIAQATKAEVPSLETDCRGHFGQLRLARAVITQDPQLSAICLETMSDQSDAAEQCRKIAANAGNLKAAPDAVCAGVPEKHRSRCSDALVAMSGDSAGCRAASGDQRSLCLGIVAFAKAGPAKNPALCGDNQACLAMAGDAAGVSVREAHRIAVDVSPILFKEAQTKLKTLSEAVDPLNEAAAREIDAREERIALLRLKLDPRSRRPARAVKGGVNAQAQ